MRAFNRWGVLGLVVSSSGETPLMIAALHGRPDVAKRLIEMGADPNATNDDGQTAAHCAALVIACYYQEPQEVWGIPVAGRPASACVDDKIRVVSLLVAHGANLNARDGFGLTPLSMSAKVLDKRWDSSRFAFAYPDDHQLNIQIVEALVRGGADPAASQELRTSATIASFLSEKYGMRFSSDAERGLAQLLSVAAVVAPLASVVAPLLSCGDHCADSADSAATRKRTGSPAEGAAAPRGASSDEKCAPAFPQFQNLEKSWIDDGRQYRIYRCPNGDKATVHTLKGGAKWRLPESITGDLVGALSLNSLSADYSSLEAAVRAACKCH